MEKFGKLFARNACIGAKNVEDTAGGGGDDDNDEDDNNRAGKLKW
jgi:hypothetical protein